MLRKNRMALDKDIVFLDNASTTEVHPDVLKVFLKANEDYFANPSSIHFEGQKASRLVDKSKSVVLSTLGLERTHKLVLTSGTTESNNLAIKGYALKYKNRGNHKDRTPFCFRSI